VQTLGAVPYLRSATLFTLDGQPSNRVSLGLSGGYTIQGSPDGTTNGLPLQYGPLGSVRARLMVTRVDGVTLNAASTQSTFITGQEQFIVQGVAGYERALTRTLGVSVGGGAAYTREVIPDGQLSPAGTYLEVLPVAAVGLNWRLASAVVLNGNARLFPFADRFTGLVYERVEGRLQVDWVAARDWRVMGAASGAQAVPVGRADQAGDRIVGGEGSVSWAVKTWLLLQGAARVLWTEQPRLGIAGQVQALATISVTVREQDALAW
jgi:hypothetical protein